MAVNKEIETPTNMAHLIEELLRDKYDYSDIGKLFFESLRFNKNDELGYDYPYDKLSISEENVPMKKTIRKVRNYFLMTINEHNKPSEIYSMPFSKDVNEASLVGIINQLVDIQGESAFYHIGEKVYDGALDYLEKNPEAELNVHYQSREYRRIRLHLENLIEE